MKMKIAGFGLLAFLALVAIGFAAYLYSKNFGVPYVGLARLDYNWRYYSAQCPKDAYHFEGRAFSFDYPKFNAKDPIKEFMGTYGGMVYFDDKLMEIFWNPKESDGIKKELESHLGYRGSDMSSFSADFMRWLLPGEDKLPGELSEIYEVKSEQISLRGGESAVLLTCMSKVREWPNMRYVVGITPAGAVFKLSSKIRFNVPNEFYWEEAGRSSLMGPRPEQDAAAACAFRRVMDTFGFVK